MDGKGRRRGVCAEEGGRMRDRKERLGDKEMGEIRGKVKEKGHKREGERKGA